MGLGLLCQPLPLLGKTVTESEVAEPFDLAVHKDSSVANLDTLRCEGRYERGSQLQPGRCSSINITSGQSPHQLGGLLGSLVIFSPCYPLGFGG